MTPYPKPFLSTSELVKKLIDRKMIILSESAAEIELNQIGYYRLKGYWFNKIDKSTSDFLSGTTFENIVQLYQFDTELSKLMFGFITSIEIALRAGLVEAFQPIQDPLVLFDPSYFKNDKTYYTNLSSLFSEIGRSSDIFIKHNIEYHNAQIPIWAVVQIMSFGMLSKIIKSIDTHKSNTFKLLANRYKYKTFKGNYAVPSQDMLSSWTQSLTVVRNICAHNGRLYNREITDTPSLPVSDAITDCRKCKIYHILLVMKYLRPSNESWECFVTDFKILISKYTGIIDLFEMGFPADWEVHLNISDCIK